MSAHPILAAKVRLATIRSDFEAKKAQEWIEIKARAQTELDEAVWHARHVEGMSVYAIAQHYGTTNRKTIYDILARAEAQREILGLSRTNEPEPATEPYTWEVSTDPAGYVCTENQSGARAYVDAKGTPVSAEGKTLDGKTMAMLLFNPAHEAWATYPGTRA